MKIISYSKYIRPTGCIKLQFGLELLLITGLICLQWGLKGWYLSFPYGTFSWPGIIVCDFQVWVRKGDGSKTKLYIGQLQKGKYRIKKSWKIID